MIYAFDIDGTLTRYPEMLGEMMKALWRQGHEIIVITGCLTASPTTEDQREAQLYNLKPQICFGTHYTKVHVVQGDTTDDVARGKGELCKKLGVSVMFEDTIQWCEIIRKLSPDTAVLWICP